MEGVESFIENLKKKEIDSLNYVIDKYSNLMFRVAFSVLNNRELSSECLNDSLMKIWNFCDGFEGNEDKFKNWICTITKYTAIDILRKEKRHANNLNIDDFENEHKLLKYDEDEIIMLKEEINKMEKLDKEIFIRRFLNEEKIKDIAASLELTENTVNLRILRGKKKLTKKIRGEK